MDKPRGASRRGAGDGTGDGTGRRGMWHRTAAWYRAVGVSAMALGMGLAVGRVDLVVLAAPLVIGFAAATLVTRPLLGRPVPTADVAVGAAAFGANRADVATEIRGLEAVELATVAQPNPRGPVGSAVTVLGGPGEPSSMSIDGQFVTRQWGVTGVARPDILGSGPDGLYLAGPVRRGPVRGELVLPEVTAIAPLPLGALTGGWAGAHLSRRPGQGSDLVDLREFAPGDRLRSIHWRAYARHQRLYTRRTLSDADAELMLCIDLSAVIQPRLQRRSHSGVVRGWRSLGAGTVAARDWWREQRGDERPGRRRATERRLRQSSVDMTVAAATAVAAAHLGQGDRVGLITATTPKITLRPGTGNRQLRRIRHRLALLDGRRRRLLPVPWWGLRPSQIVVFCSPLITAESFQAVADCVARGHRVIVVDTMPMTGVLGGARDRDIDHLRVLTIERALRVERLRGLGVAVLEWDAGDISLQMAAAHQTLQRAGR